MVHQLLRNQQDAEEVTQDAFIGRTGGWRISRGDSGIFNMALPNRHQSGPEPLLVLVAQEARQVGLDRCAA